MIDSKTYVYTEPYRGDREPGSAVHDMAIRLTMDSQLTITAIEVSMAATPYPTCTQVAPNFQGTRGDHHRWWLASCGQRMRGRNPWLYPCAGAAVPYGNRGLPNH